LEKITLVIKEMRYSIKNYLRAIWLWADIFDVFWWKNQTPENPYSLDCKLAWDVAKGIWLDN